MTLTSQRYSKNKETPSLFGDTLNEGIVRTNIDDETSNFPNQDAPLFGDILTEGVIRSNSAEDSSLNYFGNNLDDSNQSLIEDNRTSPLSQNDQIATMNSNNSKEFPEFEVKVYRHQQTSSVVEPSKGSISLEDTQTKISRISNHDISAMLVSQHRFAVINHNLHCWDPRKKHYIGLVGDKADLFIRQNTPEHLKSHITTRTSYEIVKWLLAKEQLHVNEKSLSNRNIYVPFTNCAVRFSDLTIHAHSPDLYFTSVINSSYPLNERPNGKNFENFMDRVTGGTLTNYMRLQELFGYVLSEIRDVKVIPFLLGPKDSGKSIVLKLLINMVGEEYSTNLSIDQMNQQEYLCHLFGKKLNACGEISELPLSRLDTLKKLSGGDYVMARYLFAQAIKFVNEAALLFAGNHLPILRGVDDQSNAFSQRVRIFPFDHQVPKSQQDIHLLDKLLEEKSYIAKWSIEGLQRWSQNKYQFTSYNEIEDLEQNYSNTKNSIECFVDSWCLFEAELKTYNTVLTNAYERFCKENSFIQESDRSFHKYMKQVEGLVYKRFRDKDDKEKNEFGYLGIGLREN